MRTLRIGLLWHSVNSGNLGVGALTVANMAIVRSVCDQLGLKPQFLVIGMRDDGARYIPRQEADAFSVTTRALLTPGGCWRHIGAQDCVIDMGSGDSFTDIYGAKRLWFLWLTKMIAIARKRPLLLGPQTIGPFSSAGSRALARVALKHAAQVFARDRLSRDAVLALAPGARLGLSADVAFALPFADRSRERGGAVLRVGLNVSGLLFSEAEAGRNRFGLSLQYADFTRRLIAALVTRPGVEVCLLNHVSSPGPDDDDAASLALAREFPSIVRAPAFNSPSEAKSYISGLDFLVAARMHACIAAYSAGTPVVPIAYSRKFSGVFDMLDYRWLVPPVGMSTETGLAFVLECLERRDEMMQDIRKGMPRAEILLDAYRAGLATFLAQTIAA